MEIVEVKWDDAWIDTDDWDEDGVPFEKVKKIISKLGNEDETISQKSPADSRVSFFIIPNLQIIALQCVRCR